MRYRHGDKVWISKLGLEGTVIEEKTRTVVVRYLHDGDLKDHNFELEDITPLPTTKERQLEHGS
ncbi:MAG TPA: hypothetical protein VEJ20_05960 [Candidatus Eremiobacteraceae bacterium]|nr:hypothetical protein [Candidatus Eremiobacteraceae bacterium]